MTFEVELLADDGYKTSSIITASSIDDAMMVAEDLINEETDKTFSAVSARPMMI